MIIPPHFSFKTWLSTLFLGCIPHFIRSFVCIFTSSEDNSPLREHKQELHVNRFLGSHCWYSSSPKTRAGLEGPICPFLCLWSFFEVKETSTQRKGPQRVRSERGGPCLLHQESLNSQDSRRTRVHLKGKLWSLPSPVAKWCHGPVTFSGVKVPISRLSRFWQWLVIYQSQICIHVLCITELQHVGEGASEARIKWMSVYDMHVHLYLGKSGCLSVYFCLHTTGYF